MRWRTRRVSAFFAGIARIRRICSNAAGTRYSIKCMNDLMAASRLFLELGSIAPLCFQMMEKAHHERRIELFETECRRGDLETFTRVFKEQLESIGIGRTGVVARGPFEGQALLRKAVMCGAIGVMAALP